MTIRLCFPTPNLIKRPRRVANADISFPLQIVIDLKTSEIFQFNPQLASQIRINKNQQQQQRINNGRTTTNQNLHLEIGKFGNRKRSLGSD